MVESFLAVSALFVRQTVKTSCDPGSDPHSVPPTAHTARNNQLNRDNFDAARYHSNQVSFRATSGIANCQDVTWARLRAMHPRNLIPTPTPFPPPPAHTRSLDKWALANLIASHCEVRTEKVHAVVLLSRALPRSDLQ